MSAREWLRALPRSHLYALIAAVLAAGAPVGLLAVRLAGPPEADLAGIHRELHTDSSTYLYVSASTLVVFALFGYLLGRQADVLLALSRTDPLTGLGNPLALEERLEQETARAARYGQPLSVLVLDVDRLKDINDHHGHHAGDLALRAVARALRNGARETDLAARIGGDEFVLLAPSTSGPAAAALAERVRSLVAAEGFDGLTVSTGIATAEGGRPADPRALLEGADGALYEAKRRGRNRVGTA